MSAELFSCCIQGDKHPVYRVQTLRFACSFTTQKNFTRFIHALSTFTSRWCAQYSLVRTRSQKKRRRRLYRSTLQKKRNASYEFLRKKSTDISSAPCCFSGEINRSLV